MRAENNHKNLSVSAKRVQKSKTTFKAMQDKQDCSRQTKKKEKVKAWPEVAAGSKEQSEAEKGLASPRQERAPGRVKEKPQK